MAAVTINSSLWNDVVRAGYNPLLALRLSDIYAWSIDFFGLRKGDSFMAIYEELYVGDKFVDIGTIHGAYFTHAGREYDAYRFIQDEVAQYWNEKGENLRKAFLKAPLSFSRISSGFSYARRHPVTRVVRPHTGVDYAAPRGTPVMSIGDGVVIQKSYAGGGGNTVRIKHNSTYTTAYLHLHNYAKGLAVGKRVRQGEVIGYVGSTGLSTGPHLDFRVWKNGKAINPLTMEAPPADPIKKSSAESFKETISRVMMQRDSLISVGYIDSLILKLGKR
jgi:murein DD-endopeptidase MepM/ murein hydrolase activator NlpD